MNENDLISVIVPVYNVEEYFKECLDCLINQTYKELEIVLIDDGSTDSSGKICDEYAEKDKRIKVIHKKNGGVAETRNIGLENINGKYIAFVDPDDKIAIDYFETLYNLIKNSSADISICDYTSFKDGEMVTITDSANYKEYVYNNKEAIHELNNNKFTLALWSKLYKSSLFYDEKFPLIKTSSDNFIAYRLLYKANKIVFSNNKKYFYRENEKSLTHKNLNFFIVTEGIKIIDYIKERVPEEFENTIIKYCFLTLGIYNEMITNNINDNEKEEIIIEKIDEWYKVIKHSKKIKGIRKIQLKLFIYNKKIYKIIYKKFIKGR